MSEMVYNKGKLIPLKESIEYYAERNVPDDHPALGWRGGDKVKVAQYEIESLTSINGKWYTVEWEKECEDLHQLCNLTEYPDGVISFETYHYNGAGHWTEVVEEGINNGNLRKVDDEQSV